MKNTNRLKLKFKPVKSNIHIGLISLFLLYCTGCENRNINNSEMQYIKIEHFEKSLTTSGSGDTMNKFSGHYFFIKNYTPNAENLNKILEISDELRDELQSKYSNYGHIANICFYNDSTNFSPYFKDKHVSWKEFNDKHLILVVEFKENGFKNITCGNGLFNYN